MCLGGNFHLFSNDNPESTLKGLGYRNKQVAIDSIKKIEETFSKLRDKQKINKCTPKNLNPKYFLNSQEAIEKYYLQQKMYRILALYNRARFSKYPNEESIYIFQIWLKDYRERSKKYSNIHFDKCI